jgi:hypothetical protein
MVLMLKINLKKIKNILKNNRYYNNKHNLSDMIDNNI